MMRKIILLLSCFYICIATFAQNNEEKAKLKYTNGGFAGNKYYINGHNVTFDDMMMELRYFNPKAASTFKLGRRLSTTGTVLSSLGAFVVGYDLGLRLGAEIGNTESKADNDALLGGGIILVTGIILNNVGSGKMKNALRLYKNEANSPSISLSKSGIGLALNF